MKAIFTIVFLFIIQNSYSQTDTNEQEKKPSWGSKMPTREAMPNLKYDTDLDDGGGVDMGDFGMDRSRLLDSEEGIVEKGNIEDSIQVQLPVVTSTEELKKIEENKRDEVEKIKQQQKMAEKERVAANKLEQKIKSEEAKIAAKQLKAQLKAQLKEQQRLDEEKRIAEQIANKEDSPSQPETKEELLQEQPVSDEGQLETVVVAPTAAQKYRWKKIKNSLPVYPTKALRGNKEGWVEVKLTIDVFGIVVDAKAIRFANNYRGFNNAAVRAVKKWKYEPPNDFGIATQLSRVVRIVFQQ